MPDRAGCQETTDPGIGSIPKEQSDMLGSPRKALRCPRDCQRIVTAWDFGLSVSEMISLRIVLVWALIWLPPAS